jgi:hypothetical protein
MIAGRELPIALLRAIPGSLERTDRYMVKPPLKPASPSTRAEIIDMKSAKPFATDERSPSTFPTGSILKDEGFAGSIAKGIAIDSGRL